MPPLTYHGGPVMSSGGTVGKNTVTPIYWAPSGYSFPAGYESLNNTFVANVAAASGSPTNVFATNTQYTDGTTHIKYLILAGSAIIDTDPYPVTGACAPDLGGVYSDNTGYAVCVSDQGLANEVATVLAAHGLQSDLGHQYIMFLPKSVESCFSATNGGGGGSCSINAANPTQSFCGYHSGAFVAGGTELYTSMPFPIYDSPTHFGCSPNGVSGLTDEQPNGNLNADVVVSVVSHEINETITDPEGSAWYDSVGNENGDDCAYIYGGGFGGTPGTYYNQIINGGHYFLQEEFSNEDFNTVVANSCVQREENPSATFTLSPLQPRTNSPVSFDGTTSNDPDHTGAIVAYIWNFGDGSTPAVGATANHSYASAGTYSPTLTVTDVDGWTATISHQVVVGPSDFSIGVNPSNVTVARGKQVQTMVSTTLIAGTAETVTLSASPLPAGVTAAFNPATITAGASSTLTLTASSGATLGTTQVSVTGQAASATHAANLTLIVNLATGNDFNIGLNPTTVTVARGQARSTTVTTTLTTGVAETVTLSASPLPAGVTAVFSPTSVTAGASSTLTLTASTGVTLGTTVVNVTGEATSATHSAALTLTVNANDFSIGLNPTTVTVARGQARSTTVSTTLISGVAETITLSASPLPAGVTAAFNPTTVIAGGASTLTLTASTGATLATTQVNVTGQSTSATHSAALTLTVNANDFNVGLNPAAITMAQGQAKGAPSAVSTTLISGSAEAVTLSASPLPAGVTAAFNPATVVAGGSSTLTLTASIGATLGTTQVNVTGQAASATHSAALTLTIVTMWNGPTAVVGASGAGAVTGQLYAVSDGPGRVDAFWKGADNNVWTAGAIGGTWGSAHSIGGGPIGSDPRPVSSRAGVMDLFWKGGDNGLWHMWSVDSGASWNGPASLGGAGTLTGAPGPVIFAPGAIDVFWKDANANLAHAWYFDGGGWNGPQVLGYGPLGSDPHPVSAGLGRVDVFWKGTGASASLWHAWSWGHGWSGPGFLGSGPLGSQPHPVSSAGGRIDVFWQGGDNGLWHSWYFDGAGWFGPGSLGATGTMRSDPATVSAESSEIGVFWQGADGNVNTVHYVDGAGWTASMSIGGGPLPSTAAPQPVSSAAGATDVLWRGIDGGAHVLSSSHQ